MNNKKINKKNKLHFTLQLYHLFEQKEQPELVLKFIYINLFDLIKETQFIDNFVYKATVIEEEIDPMVIEAYGEDYDFSREIDRISENWFYNQYFELYQNYYAHVEDLVKDKDDWLLSLFAPCRYNFSFKLFYEGFAGRLTFLSEESSVVLQARKNNNEPNITSLEPIYNYWYDNPNDFTVSYHISLNDDEKLIMYKCKFVILEKYSNGQLAERLGPGYRDSYLFILFKRHWGDKYKFEKCLDIFNEDFEMYRKTRTLFSHIQKQTEFNSLMENYKKNCNKIFNPKIRSLCYELLFKSRYLNYIRDDNETRTKDENNLLEEVKKWAIELDKRREKRLKERLQEISQNKKIISIIVYIIYIINQKLFE